MRYGAMFSYYDRVSVDIVTTYEICGQSINRLIKHHVISIVVGCR